MKKYHFSKMHGRGNDLVIIQDIDGAPTLDKIKLLCDRRFGIGCDQLIVFKKLTRASVEMHTYNSDGSIAKFCGNGAICLAGLLNYKVLDIKINNNLIFCTKNQDIISVNPGKVILNGQIETEINGKKITGYKAEIYNSHAVFFVEKIDFDICEVAIAVQKKYSEKLNVHFALIKDKENITIFSYEVGAGMTLSCGSGACATFFAGLKNNLIAEKITVLSEHGNLTLELNQNKDIILSGNYTYVFSGSIVI